MRQYVTRAAMIGSCLWLAGCAGDSQGPASLAARLGVDPDDAVERATEGAVLGAVGGAAVGAMFSINPGIGATIGTEAGGAIGAVIGVASAQPLRDYAPISAPSATVIPGYYDSWPPGNTAPPIGTDAPPPPRPGHPGSG